MVVTLISSFCSIQWNSLQASTGIVRGKRMQESVCLGRDGRSFIAFSFITFQICPPCVYGVFLKTQWSAKQRQHCYLRTATLNWTFVLNEGCKIGNYLHHWLFHSAYMWKRLTVCYPGNTFSDFYSSLLKLRVGTIDVLLLLLKKGW